MAQVKKVSKDLPDSINIVNHVSARIKDLKKIYNDVATKKSDMLIHQMLPNYMRRRAMSHNPKRLPVKYRQIHTSQMQKSGLFGVLTKAPSRKHRRRTGNLLKEFHRRAQKNIWLETHIWHAKRFRIRNMWGYRIPYTPTDKRYKASYRAAVKHCLLQDISYYPCIQITGPHEKLKSSFSRVINMSQIPTITARCFVSGTREGKCMIYKVDSYPYDAITEVSFIWRPNQDDGERTLWIFSHPTAFEELFEEFKNLFYLSENETGFFVRNEKFSNTITGVSMLSLKDTINRFRLTGSHSNAVLSKAFKVSTSLGFNWLQNLCSENEDFQLSHLVQMTLWEKFASTKSPLDLPLHCVINLNIDDPRTNRNEIKKRNVRDDNLTFSNGSEEFEVSMNMSNSPLWDQDLRDNISASMMTNSELNEHRYKRQLVPTIATSFEKNMLQPVPILIIQQPNDLMSGWDIIIPAGYALSVWLSLIKFGAKAGGWREYEMISSEMGRDIFAPDSISGIKESKNLTEQLKSEYFRKPPNKRTNFIKLGIASPFACPFKELLNEWNGRKSEKFFILRDMPTIENLSNALSLKKSFPLNLDENSLVPVKIELMSNGAPGDFSILCLPNKKDIKYMLMTNHRNSSELQENIHHDPYENERKIKKFAHKKLLKRLKNKRVRRQRKNREKFSFLEKIELQNLIKEQFKKMCELWLPEPKSIRHQCSREVIGYVTKSRFTFSIGKVSSIGYIASKAFDELLKRFEKFKNVKPFVLIRSTNSTCFYTAKVIVQ